MVLSDLSLKKKQLGRRLPYRGEMRFPTLPKRFWLYLSIFAASLAITSASLVFAYLAGFGLWLEERPPSFWLISLALSFVGGGCLGGAAVFYWLEKGIVTQIREVATYSDPEIRAALGRILLLLAAQRSVAATQRERRLAEAVLLLTRSSVIDGQCVHCGSSHKGLLSGGEFNPAFHSRLSNEVTGEEMPCPAPYARRLAEEVRAEVFSKSLT